MPPTEPDSAAAAWFSSSYSGNNVGQCVEVAFVGDGVCVRDTKQHGDGPVLTFTRAEWTAFLAGVQAGEFEQP